MSVLQGDVMDKYINQQTANTTLVNREDYEFQASLIKAINEASPEGILVVDDNNIIISHNQRFVEIWRIPVERLRGREPDSAIGADDDPILATVLGRVKNPAAFIARVRELYENPDLTDHCEIELLDGRTVERHSTVLCKDDGQYLGRVWFFRDITEQKRTEASLQELAHHDPLTGVANRRFFFERARQEFARIKRKPSPLSIVTFDVDYFKLINDHFGHAVGDEFLISLCKTCLPLMRESDIFARIGGEEFAILLPDTNLEGAAVVAERFRKAIGDNPLSLPDGELSCTISVGVAMLKTTDGSIDDCLLRADNALYDAKRNGRNRVKIES